MNDTVWTLAELQALEKAIASGARSVSYADKRVEYRSLAEMQQLRDQIRRALGMGNDNGRRYATFSNGC